MKLTLAALLDASGNEICKGHFGQADPNGVLDFYPTTSPSEEAMRSAAFIDTGIERISVKAGRPCQNPEYHWIYSRA